MILARERAVRLFDVLFGRCPGDAEHVVVIAKLYRHLHLSIFLDDADARRPEHLVAPV